MQEHTFNLKTPYIRIMTRFNTPRILFFILLCVCGIGRGFSQDNTDLVPYPNKISLSSGYFDLSVPLKLENTDFPEEASYLSKLLASYKEIPQGSKRAKNRILLSYDANIKNPEGYSLIINKQQINLSASSSDGIFNGIQTLHQLIELNKTASGIQLPSLQITDAPAFHWRGTMLDVSRHFFSIDYLKQHIDRLAYYKMNKLHLHLTDDQGWRIEIKKYPKLTEEGAYRTFNGQDSACLEKAKTDPNFEIDPQFIAQKDGKPVYGGFYTQDQLRDLIAYATERNVEIIPEIDMPGHMMAAIKAYPELSCSGKATWGNVFSEPLCPGNEQVYTFLEGILDEVSARFPSPYIHIGADEVEKDTWRDSEACKALMEREHLKSVDELQSYFVNRIKQYLEKKGKKVIAWDEVLEGGIGSDVNVMYWRDWVGGASEKALANGNPVIFTPGTPLYLSNEGHPMYDIYNFKPFKHLNEQDRSQILGAQANLWAERIPNENRLNYLLYPRILALAEMTWTKDEQRDWKSFISRLGAQREFLDREQVKQMPASNILIPLLQTDSVQKAIRIDFDTEQVAPQIYYTLDGTIPTKASSLYTGTIAIRDSATITAGILDGDSLRRPFFTRRLDYHKAIGKLVQYKTTWNKTYPAAGTASLTDGYRGGDKHNDGYWQGFNKDIEAVVDMGTSTDLSKFAATFIQNIGPGIYMPEFVEISISDDGQHYEKVGHIDNDTNEEEKGLFQKTFAFSLKGKKARYIKVFAKNKAANRFMFTDEFVIY